MTEKPEKSKAIESSQGIEFRAGGSVHGPDKPGWGAGGREKHPGNVKMSSMDKITSTSQKLESGFPSKDHRWEFCSVYKNPLRSKLGQGKKSSKNN